MKPPGWTVYLGVDRPGPWWTRSFTEKPVFTRASLSGVRVIMAIMHVLLEELLSQVVTGRVLVLECLLSGARGCQMLHPVLSSIKWPHSPRGLSPGHMLGTENPLSWLLRVQACVE
jgi:hypothetical protein